MKVEMEALEKKKEWRDGMKVEMEALEKKSTWKLLTNAKKNVKRVVSSVIYM